MTDDSPSIDRTRRTLLRGTAGALATGALAGSIPAQAAAAEPFGGWLSNTSNFDGLVDKTGQDTVTITVGSNANGGSNGFGPAAVRVDPGATVVWEWSGNGYHNVKAQGGGFTSETTNEEGFTFEQTFEESGVTKYFCVPHKMMGMKGVVVVGDVEVATGGSEGQSEQSSGPDYGDWFKNVSNFESTVDKTGQDSVTIKVGTSGNNGSFAFDPPAVKVDPGTTIVWEWTGKGGVHNVVAEDGSFGSETVGDAGHTFEYTVEEGGIHKYACTPHKNMGMRGAIVVDAPNGGAMGLNQWLTIGGAIGLVGGLFGLIGAEQRQRQKQERLER